MLELYHHGKITLEQIAEKMAHNVATIFQIEKRGFIREGYHADLVLVNLSNPWQINKSNILSKCGWSPFEGSTFKSKVVSTIVSGNLAYENGAFTSEKSGQRMTFAR
jgi:dihydroorotase